MKAEGTEVRAAAAGGSGGGSGGGSLRTAGASCQNSGQWQGHKGTGNRQGGEGAIGGSQQQASSPVQLYLKLYLKFAP